MRSAREQLLKGKREGPERRQHSQAGQLSEKEGSSQGVLDPNEKVKIDSSEIGEKRGLGMRVHESVLSR